MYCAQQTFDLYKDYVVIYICCNLYKAIYMHFWKPCGKQSGNMYITSFLLVFSYY